MRVFFKDARTYRFDARRISQLLASCATSMVQKASFFLYKIFDQKIFSKIFDLKNFYRKNHQIFEQFFIKKNLTCYATVIVWFSFLAQLRGKNDVALFHFTMRAWPVARSNSWHLRCCLHLTRCLRTLRARLLRAREGPWSGQDAASGEKRTSGQQVL